MILSELPDRLRPDVLSGKLWLMVVKSDTVQKVVTQIEHQNKQSMYAIQVETIDEAERLLLLIEIFKGWNTSAIKKFIGDNPNMPKLKNVL